MAGIFKKPRSTKSLSYLALGDSYTIGEGVHESDRYPNLTARKLQADGALVENPKIIAKTGWTTGELLEAMHAEHIVKQRFDLVSILIGVNNQYRGLSLDQYRLELDDLIQTALKINRNRPNRVFILSIPDWGVTPFGKNDARGREQITQEIQQFNRVKQELCEVYEAKYVDISTIYGTLGHLPENLVEDQLHPSGRMYALWADLLKKHITQSL